MPFIHVKTNQKITAAQEQALKTQLGEAIALIPGKTERWLMVQVEDGDRLWFAGSNAPAALLEVQLFGRAQPKDYDRLTAKLTQITADALQIPADRVYIPYAELTQWGWNSENF